MTLPEGKVPGSSGVRGPWGERVGPQGESWKVPFSVSPRALEVPRIAPPVGPAPGPRALSRLSGAARSSCSRGSLSVCFRK